MTAIFAYARDDILFVAGDTRRGETYPLTVQKIHSWGAKVLLGQSGNGREQSRLISGIKLARTLPEHEGEDQFSAAYTALHSNIRAQVQGLARSNGTILAAAIDAGTGTPRLVAYDFDTGVRTELPHEIGAVGWDDAALTAIAISHMQRLNLPSGFPLDEWARCCIIDAINAFSDQIGWPCDMVISRPIRQGGRVLIERRIEHDSMVGLPDFAI